MVAEDSVPVQVVVVAPKMDAPRCALPEAVEGGIKGSSLKVYLRTKNPNIKDVRI